MTDALLDEATRLADVAPVGSAAEQILATPRVLRALVERVQQAEALKNDYAQQYEDAVDARVAAMNERDEARGKLDKVRAVASRYLNECDQSEVLARDVLAILDGKETE